VTPVNDAPVAGSQAVAVVEDTAKPITLTGYDAEGSALTYTVVRQPTKGTLSGTAPNLVYTPSTNANGADNFTFKVSDGTLESGLATVTIVIAAVNDAPVVTGQTVTTDEDAPVAITLGASDVEGDALTYTIVAGPTKGELTGTAPNLVYVPNAEVSGTDSFTFKVNDGTVDSGLATVSITVNAVNDAPVAGALAVKTDEDTAVALTLQGFDAEGAKLTYTVVRAPANGVLSGEGANLEYMPNPDFNGKDSFTYKVNDGSLDSSAVTVAITVASVPDPPVALTQTVKVGQGNTGPVTLQAYNPDNAALTYKLVSQPKQGTLSGTIPNLVYRANDDASGTDSFTFRVNDGTSDSGLAAVIIAIEKSSNTPPTFINLTGRNIRELSATSFRLLARDNDLPAQKLTYGLVSGPKGLAVSADGVLTWTPTEEQGPSTNTVTVRVTDSGIPALSTTNSITLFVTEANTAPTLVNAFSRSIFENAKFSSQLIARDTDLPAQKLTFSLVSGPAGLTLNAAGLLEWTPSEEQGPSTNKVVVRVTDDAPTALSTTATFLLTVREANAAPVFPATNFTVAAQSKLSVALKATDADIPVQVLKYSLSRGPAGLTVSTNGLLEWTPPASLANTTNSVTVSVTDGTATVSTVFRVLVRPVGSGPGSEGKASQKTYLSMQVQPDQSLALRVVGPEGGRFRVESSSLLGAEWQTVDSVGQIETLGDEVPVVVPIPADGIGQFRQFRLRKD